MQPSIASKTRELARLRPAGALAALCFVACLAPPSFAQAPLPDAGPPPAALPPAELDRIVSPIALYPDPLLAQVLAAATFSADIPDAARWADQHHYVPPAQLPAEITADQPPWDPSVQALLPFPSVLGMMAADPAWTQELGTAFLAQQQDVMDAVQRMRRQASDFGYLRSNQRVIVNSTASYIEILPANPDFVVVPYYNPAIVYARPRPGFLVAGAINFGFGVTIGAGYAPWGWGSTRFGWGERRVFFNNAPWGRTWANRATYVHPYAARRFSGPRPVEQHRLIERTAREREAQRTGHVASEQHHEERPKAEKDR